MEISVVIPVYGCKGALKELHERLTATLSSLTSDYEIILVDDCCPQGSWESIEEICAEDKRVVGLQLSRNFGQGRAITAGVEHSSGTWVVVMDCDLQDRPEEIAKLYAKAMEGYDVVFAKRKDRKDKPFKKFVSWVFYKLYQALTDVDFNFEYSNFSICNRAVVDAFLQIRECHRDYGIMIFWVGFKRTDIDVKTDERKEGKSSYNLRKKIALAEDLLTSQSDKLLKFTAHAGFALTAIAMISIVYLVLQYVFAQIDDGWTSIVAVMLLLGGLLMSAIGIAGIYIGNIFVQAKGRPLYFTSRVLNGAKEGNNESGFRGTNEA